MKGKFIQNKSVVQSWIGEEVVMLDIESGYYFGLNPMAVKIWEMMSIPIDFDNLINELIQNFNVERNTCINDTTELLKNMLDRKLIIKIE